MVPQKEVYPPKETLIKADITTAEMTTIGKEIFEGKGLCTTCHTIGKKAGPFRFPDLENVAVRAKTREPGLSDVDYFAQTMYEPDSFIVPGFNPGMPTINKPPIVDGPEILCVMAFRSRSEALRTTLATKHHNGASIASRPPRRRHRAAGAGHAGPGAQAMIFKIPVILAILAVFAFLRFRKAGLLAWALAWWLGFFVLVRFGFTVPIPASVVVIYMGIASIALLAYVTSSTERRAAVSGPIVDLIVNEKRRLVLAAVALAIPALAAAGVYVRLSQPSRLRSSHARSPGIAIRHHVRTRRSTSIR
jgi:hypothetical protein